MTDATLQLPPELREQFAAMASNPGDLADITGIYAWLHQHPNLQTRLLRLQDHLRDGNYQKAFDIALNTMSHLDPTTENGLLHFIFVCLFLHKTLNNEAIKKYFSEIPQFDYHSNRWQAVHMTYHHLTGIKFFQKEQVLKHAVPLRGLIKILFPKPTATQQHSETKKTTIPKTTPAPKSVESEAKITTTTTTPPNDKRDIIDHRYGKTANSQMTLLTWVLQAAINYSKQPSSEFTTLIAELKKIGIPEDEIKATAEWVNENWEAVRKGMLSGSEDEDVRKWILSEHESLNTDKIRDFIRQAAAIDIPAVNNYRH